MRISLRVTTRDQGQLFYVLYLYFTCIYIYDEIFNELYARGNMELSWLVQSIYTLGPMYLLGI